MKNSALISKDSGNTWVDIYQEYGASFIKGSYTKLIMRQQVKEYVKNESRLQNGSRYLLGSDYTKYKEKTTRCDILIEATSESDLTNKIEGFTDFMATGSLWLKIPSKYRVLKLVYNDIQYKDEYRGNKVIFTIELIEPDVTDRIEL